MNILFTGEVMSRPRDNLKIEISSAVFEYKQSSVTVLLHSVLVLPTGLVLSCHSQTAVKAPVP